MRLPLLAVALLLVFGIPAQAVDLTACGTLSASTSYTVLNNVDAGAGNICFTLNGAGITLNLNGFTVTGRIKGATGVNLHGTTIYGGTITCSYTGSDRGCIRLSHSSSTITRIIIHDLTCRNTATSAASKSCTSVDWGGRSSVDYIFEGYNLDYDSGGGSPASSRIINLEIISSGSAKVYDSTFRCQDDDNACQGIVFFGINNAEAYGNTFNLEERNPSTANATARGLIVDQDQPNTAASADIHHNVCNAADQRCFRFRNATAFDLHHNTINDIQLNDQNYGVIHIGDPDYGGAGPSWHNYEGAKVRCNTMAFNGGIGVWSRDATNVFVRDNTVTGTSGRFSRTGTPCALTSTINYEFNSGAASLGTASDVQTGATANHDTSGSFTGVTTNGCGGAPGAAGTVTAVSGSHESCGAAAPLVSLSASSLSFTPQLLNVTSAGQAFTITNTGDATLNITSIVASGTHAADFNVSEDCATTLAAAAFCTVTVSFTPSAAGARSAAVTITTDAASSPDSVTLSGTGITKPTMTIGAMKP